MDAWHTLEFGRRAAFLALVAGAAGCGGTARRPAPGTPPAELAAAGRSAGAESPGGKESHITVVVPSTDLAVGRNRLAIGVLDATQVPIADARLRIRLFHPIEPAPTLKSEADSTFRFLDDKRRGLYVSYVDFDAPGVWGLEVVGFRPDGRALTPARVRLPQPVSEKSRTPAVGDPAPRSRNLTARDVGDIRKIDSGVTPNSMHDLTIADALEQGRPLVVVFATPGYCVSQTCAPQVAVVQQLQAGYAGQANFVHIEIYKDPATRTPYETVLEWRLTSEPWVFMVDREGRVAEKFEGLAPLDELEPALVSLL